MIIWNSFLKRLACVSVSDPDLIWIRSVDPDRRAKMIHKNWKKLRNFVFWSAECSLLRADGLFCSLHVLYGGLGIGQLQVLIKNMNFFNFWPSKALIWMRNTGLFLYNFRDGGGSGNRISVWLKKDFPPYRRERRSQMSKCCHLPVKNWTVKGLYGRCLSEFKDWLEIQSVMLVFSTQLCEQLPL